MGHLLQLKTSLFDNRQSEGVSTQLSNELVAGLMAISPATIASVHDFSQDPVPYLDSEGLGALMSPEQDRSAEQSAKVSYADNLISQLQLADDIVIGVPMYNFSIPAMLKSWVDQVARAGVTFKYTEQGPVGLLANKRVYVVLAMGGVHEEGVSDHARPYLRTVLGFLGLTDIETVVADGLNLGEEAKQAGLTRARLQIRQLLARRENAVAAA